MAKCVAPDGIDAAAIAENADSSDGSVAIGTLSAADADLPNDTLTYALVSGEGDDDNASFVVVDGELHVQQNVTLDHEAQAEYSVRLSVTDSDGLLFEKALTIRVTDDNEFDPVIDDATLTVSESAGDGDVIGTVDVSDGDTSQGHTFEITGGNTNNAFAMDATTGEISVANSSELDIANRPQYVLTVEVTDDVEPKRSGTATIAIDVKQAPGVILQRTGVVYNTIAEALAAAQNGDHLLLRDGNYEGAVVVNKSVTIEAINPGQAIIDAGGAAKGVDAQTPATFIGLWVRNARFAFDTRNSNYRCEGCIVRRMSS